MRAAVTGGFLAATDLADHLVTLGWPFRRAHEAVGRLVRACIDAGIGLEQAGPAEFAASGLDGVAMPPLTAEASVEAKRAAGRHRPRGRHRPARRRTCAGGGVVSAAAARIAPGGGSSRDFFARPVAEVAPELVGCTLYHADGAAASSSRSSGTSRTTPPRTAFAVRAAGRS